MSAGLGFDDCLKAARAACRNGCGRSELAGKPASCGRCNGAAQLAWTLLQQDRKAQEELRAAGLEQPPAADPAADPASCSHEHFGAQVNVQRLEDTGRFLAELQVWCAICRLPFSFTGLPLGISTDRAMLSIDATEARLPIEPGPKAIPLSGTFPIEMSRKKES